MFKTISISSIAVISCLIAMQTVFGALEVSDDPHPELTETEKSLISSNNSFGFNLFNEIVRKDTSTTNVVISPLSIAMSLTMAYNGADGSTRTAMEDVLGFNSMSLEQINRACKSLNVHLMTDNVDVNYAAVHSIFIDDAFLLSKRFRDFNTNFYDAEPVSLDFSNPQSVDVINEWITKKTNGKVTNVLDEIPPAVVMYLLNTIYFNGTWTYPFNPDKTCDAPFTLDDGSTVTCRMMSGQRLNLPYIHEPDIGFQAVDLLYGDSSFVMTIILPDAGKDINNVMAAMNVTNWNEWLDGFHIASVALELPRFKLETNLLLNDALKSLGMGVAFQSGEADFSRINEQKEKDLWINRVIHKSVIEVNEKGTEAGAATVVEIKKRSTIIDMVVNRSFLFAIRDSVSGSILFLARATNPIA